MVFTGAEITAWVGSFLWPLFRIGALVLAAPIFSASSVPVKIRVGLALMLTLAVAPLVPTPPAVELFSLASLAIIVQQILIGATLGFTLQLVFAAIITGGQVVAMQMGLGFAQMVDPQNGLQVPVLSQFYLMMATLVFLALNGHLILVDVLVGSFQTMPISANGLLPEDFWQLARWGSYVFGGAVSMAIPTIAALLIVNISFGVMNRSAPQLNIFGIGFPVMMLFGFAIIFVTLPSVVPQFSDLVVSNVSMLRDLVTLR